MYVDAHTRPLDRDSRVAYVTDRVPERVIQTRGCENVPKKCFSAQCLSKRLPQIRSVFAGISGLDHAGCPSCSQAQFIFPGRHYEQGEASQSSLLPTIL
jgi:hypothetical protein